MLPIYLSSIVVASVASVDVSSVQQVGAGVRVIEGGRKCGSMPFCVEPPGFILLRLG